MSVMVLLCLSHEADSMRSYMQAQLSPSRTELIGCVGDAVAHDITYAEHQAFECR